VERLAKPAIPVEATTSVDDDETDTESDDSTARVERQATVDANSETETETESEEDAEMDDDVRQGQPGLHGSRAAVDEPVAESSGQRSPADGHASMTGIPSAFAGASIARGVAIPEPTVVPIERLPPRRELPFLQGRTKAASPNAAAPQPSTAAEYKPVPPRAEEGEADDDDDEL